MLVSVELRDKLLQSTELPLWHHRRGSSETHNVCLWKRWVIISLSLLRAANKKKKRKAALSHHGNGRLAQQQQQVMESARYGAGVVAKNVCPPRQWKNVGMFRKHAYPHTHTHTPAYCASRHSFSANAGFVGTVCCPLLTSSDAPDWLKWRQDEKLQVHLFGEASVTLPFSRRSDSNLVAHFENIQQ